MATAIAQPAIALPSWLVGYPGATATVRADAASVEFSYAIAAEPAEILAHYRKLFQTAGMPFQPNSDGLGTSIRADAGECDLLIQIRSRADDTFVKVTCSAKTAPVSLSADLKVTPARPQVPPGLMEMHRQKVAEMGLHREHHDAPAPPLVWPPWLVHVNGAALRTSTGVDFAKNAMLKARYITNIPMTELYTFYRDLLNSHEYPAASSITTGHTTTGIQQNALGYVSGSNYPDGAPGAYSVIYVSFDRSVLNGPITVSLRFTTHDYIASRGY